MNRYLLLFVYFTSSLSAQEKTFDYFVSCFSNGYQQEEESVRQICKRVDNAKTYLDAFNQQQKISHKTELGCTADTCLSLEQRLAFVTFILWNYDAQNNKEEIIVSSLGSGKLYHEALIALSLATFFYKKIILIGIDPMYKDDVHDYKKTLKSFFVGKEIEVLFFNSVYDYVDFIKENSNGKVSDIIVGIDFEWEQEGYKIMQDCFAALRKTADDGTVLALELLCNNNFPEQQERVIRY